jgi:8-oxo-dGTP diphosphatase
MPNGTRERQGIGRVSIPALDIGRASDDDRAMAEPAPQPPSLRRGVVAVVVRGERFLVIRRAAGIAAPGAFCFPGGGIESAESETGALVREFREELSAAIRPLRRIWRSTTSWQVELAWWLGELDEPAELLPNPAEVESIHWLTTAEMLARTELLESNRLFLDALAAGEVRLR